MEIRQHHLLPFSFQESQRGVWDSRSRFAMSSMNEVGDLKAQITHHPQYSDTEDDTLRTSFVAVVTGVAGLAGSYLRKVVRRHTSEDRAVFIFRLLSETMLCDGRSGIREVTTMHVVLEKSTAEDGRELMPSLKTYLTVERDTPIKQDPAGPLAVAAWIELASQFPEMSRLPYWIRVRARRSTIAAILLNMYLSISVVSTSKSGLSSCVGATNACHLRWT